MTASTLFTKSDLENDGTPLWFKPEKFLDPSFNPEAYVNDLKRYVPLDDLRQQLTTHANTLRGKLVEVVNDDYDEFVSLSTKLVGVDSAVASLQRPLIDIRKRVEDARAVVAEQAATLRDGLARRQTVAAARGLLELAQDAVHVMSKVEKLLADLPTTTTTTTTTRAITARAPGASATMTEAEQEELENRSRLLDRLCSEVSRLSFYSQRGDDLAIIRQMQHRIDNAKSMLQDAMNAALRSVLIAQNPTALPVLLHAYSSLGGSHAAEAIVREVIVAPIIETAVAKAAAMMSSDSAGNSAGDNVDGDGSARVLISNDAAASIDASLRIGIGANEYEDGMVPPLRYFLSCAVEELQSQAGPFLELALTPAGGSTHFDLLGGSVLPEVISAIDSNCPGVYSPGFPDSFHANYVAMMKFLSQLESFCKTCSQIERIRASSAYSDMKRKWNLIAYFSLRFQDIASTVEDVLREKPTEQSSWIAPETDKSTSSAIDKGALPRLQWAATRAAWAALQSSVDPEIFLRPLSDRFLRLCLQIVARYCAWIKEMLSHHDDQSSGTNSRDGTDDDHAKKMMIQIKKPSVEESIALWQDIAAIHEAVHRIIVPSFQNLLRIDQTAAATVETTIDNPTNASLRDGASQANKPDNEAVVSAFVDCDVQLRPAMDAVLAAVAADVAEKCCDSLKQLRGIVATFRMTARSVPTRPAQYAAAILGPLESLLKGAGSHLDEEAKKVLVLSVAGEVSRRYKQIAHDTLSTVRKTESSLRRLKSRKAGDDKAGAAGAAEQVETDKLIEMQLGLDVEEFGKRVAMLGVDPAVDVEEYAELKRAVAPETE